MRNLRWIALALFVAVVGIAARESDVKQIDADEIGRTVVVLGNLGRPLGEKVEISGLKKLNGPLIEFWADELNGKPLKHSVHLDIDGIEEWPDGTRAKFVGFERGTIQYVYAEHTNIGPEAVRTYKPHQVASLEFVPYRVEAPKGLKFEGRLKEEPMDWTEDDRD